MGDTNVTIKDKLATAIITNDLNVQWSYFDVNGNKQTKDVYSFATSFRLPDGVYYIEGEKGLVYLKNGSRANPPDIQENTYDLQGKLVKCFKPLKIINICSYLKSKGFLTTNLSPGTSSPETNYFNYEKTKINNFAAGTVSTLQKYVSSGPNDGGPPADFTVDSIYAGVIEGVVLYEANMFSECEGSQTPMLFINGRKVLSFTGTYLSKLINSPNFEKYEDYRNPFLLRSKKEMYLNNRNGFYTLDSLTKEAYVLKSVDSGVYFSLNHAANIKYKISKLEGQNELFGDSFINSSFFNEEWRDTWDNEVDFENFKKEDFEKYSARSLVFTTDCEKKWNEIFKQFDGSKDNDDYFDNFYIRYFTHANDLTKKWVEYPKSQHVYKNADSSYSIYGEKNNVKGLKGKLKILKLNNQGIDSISSFGDKMIRGEVTMPSRYLPPEEEVTLHDDSTVKSRMGSNPSLHYIIKDSKIKIADSVFLECGIYVHGRRGICLWNDNYKGNAGIAFKSADVFRKANALRYSSCVNTRLEDYSSNTTYKDKKKTTFDMKDSLAKTELNLISGDMKNQFLFAARTSAPRYTHYTGGLDLVPVKNDTDKLYYSFDPATQIGSLDKIYFYKTFLDAVLPGAAYEFKIMKARPASGAFSIGLFKDGKKVNRKTFFNSSQVENTLPMLCINPIKDNFDKYGVKYMYRPFMCYDEKGDSSLANGTFWNGTFSAGVRFGNSKITDNSTQALRDAYDSLDVYSEIINYLAGVTPANLTNEVTNFEQTVNVTKVGHELSLVEMADKTIDGVSQKENSTPSKTVIGKVNALSKINSSSIAGKLANTIFTDGHYLNGKKVVFKDLPKGEKAKYINTIFVVNGNHALEEGAIGKLITYNENGALLADGFFCNTIEDFGCERGGFFVQGVRDATKNSEEGEFYKDSNSNIVFTVENGNAIPVEGVLINQYGGPTFYKGLPSKPFGKLSGTEIEIELEGDSENPTLYIMNNTTMPFETLVGRNFSTNDLFYLNLDFEPTSLPIGIYTHNYNEPTSQTIEIEGVSYAVLLRKQYEVKEVNGKKMYEVKNTSQIISTPSVQGRITYFDQVPRSLEGSTWLTAGLTNSPGLNRDTMVVDLDKKGNGFVPYLSKVKVVVFNSYNTSKPVFYQTEFVDRNRTYAGLSNNPSNAGIYYLNGHPTPAKNDFLNAKSNSHQSTTSDILYQGYLDEKGDGVLSLAFLEGIKYKFDDSNLISYLPALTLRTEIVTEEPLVYRKQIDGVQTMDQLKAFVKQENKESEKRYSALDRKKNDDFTLQPLYEVRDWIYKSVTNKRYEVKHSFKSETPIKEQGFTTTDSYLMLDESCYDRATNTFKYEKDTMFDIVKKLSKIKFTVSDAANVQQRPVITSSYNIIDLAKSHALAFWDQSTTLQSTDRLDFANKNYKNFIHIKFEKGEAVNLIILEKWEKSFNPKSNKPVVIKRYTRGVLNEDYRKAEIKIIERLEQQKALIKENQKTYEFKAVIESAKKTAAYEKFLKLAPLEEVATDFYSFNYSSPTTFDLLSPTSDDCLSFFDENLDEDGNGYSGDIYWVNYIASPLNKDGDGFWDNAEFNKGKLV